MVLPVPHWAPSWHRAVPCRHGDKGQECVPLWRVTEPAREHRPALPQTPHGGGPGPAAARGSPR